MCRNHEFATWDDHARVCLYHYRLEKICLVVNSTTYQLEKDQKGCGSDVVETLKETSWSSKRQPSYLSWPIEIIVRSDKDPIIFIYRNNLKNLSPTSDKLITVGIVLIMIPGLLLLIIMTICIKCRSRTVYRPQFDVEISVIPKESII